MSQSKYRMETRALTEGAIMAAFTAVLAIINLYIPFLGILVALIWTLPIVSICVRHGMRAGVLTMTAAGFIILMVTSPISALTMIVPCAAPALFLGQAFRKKWSTGRTILVTSVATLISMVASLMLAFLITGISPWQQWLSLREALATSLQTMIPLYERSGALKRMGLTAEQFTTQWNFAMGLMELLLPALLLISALSSAFMNYLLANKILTKLKVELPAMVPFRHWRLPWWHIWGFTIGFALALLGGRFLPQYPILSMIGMNILIFYVPVFIMAGLMVASFFIHKVPKERRMFYKIMLLLGFFMLMNGFVVVMCSIGLFDTVFDYRRLDPDRERKKLKK